MDTGEPAILKLHPHWIGYIQFYFISMLLVAVGIFYKPFWPAIIVGILFALLGETLRRAVTYYVLESGVARGYHFLATSRRFAEYGNIQNIEVHQSFMDTIFGIGNIKFDTSGGDLIEVGFHGVPKPYRIEKIVRGKMAQK